MAAGLGAGLYLHVSNAWAHGRNLSDFRNGEDECIATLAVAASVMGLGLIGSYAWERFIGKKRDVGVKPLLLPEFLSSEEFIRRTKVQKSKDTVDRSEIHINRVGQVGAGITVAPPAADRTDAHAERVKKLSERWDEILGIIDGKQRIQEVRKLLDEAAFFENQATHLTYAQFFGKASKNHYWDVCSVILQKILQAFYSNQYKVDFTQVMDDLVPYGLQVALNTLPSERTPAFKKYARLLYYFLKETKNHQNYVTELKELFRSDLGKKAELVESNFEDLTAKNILKKIRIGDLEGFKALYPKLEFSGKDKFCLDNALLDLEMEIVAWLHNECDAQFSPLQIVYLSSCCMEPAAEAFIKQLLANSNVSKVVKDFLNSELIKNEMRYSQPSENNYSVPELSLYIADGNWDELRKFYKQKQDHIKKSTQVALWTYLLDKRAQYNEVSEHQRIIEDDILGLLDEGAIELFDQGVVTIINSPTLKNDYDFKQRIYELVNSDDFGVNRRPSNVDILKALPGSTSVAKTETLNNKGEIGSNSGNCGIQRADGAVPKRNWFEGWTWW